MRARRTSGKRDCWLSSAEFEEKSIEANPKKRKRNETKDFMRQHTRHDCCVYESTRLLLLLFVIVVAVVLTGKVQKGINEGSGKKRQKERKVKVNREKNIDKLKRFAIV